MLKIEVKEDGSYELNLEGELVSVEEEEEFWIQDNQWVEAKDLEAGDLLQTDDGDFVTVDGVEVREGSFEVFNFEVEDFHTYFVSQDGVLVHNIGPCKFNTSLSIDQNKTLGHALKTHGEKPLKKNPNYLRNRSASQRDKQIQKLTKGEITQKQFDSMIFENGAFKKNKTAGEMFEKIYNETGRIEQNMIIKLDQNILKNTIIQNYKGEKIDAFGIFVLDGNHGNHNFISDAYPISEAKFLQEQFKGTQVRDLRGKL